MTALELLTETRALLSKPEAWTKGESWRTVDGEPTNLRERAACFCVYGALDFVHPGTSSARANATSLLEDAVGTLYAHEWNDAPERTHSEVLEALDKAIELAKERNL